MVLVDDEFKKKTSGRTRMVLRLQAWRVLFINSPRFLHLMVCMVSPPELTQSSVKLGRSVARKWPLEGRTIPFLQETWKWIMSCVPLQMGGFSTFMIVSGSVYTCFGLRAPGCWLFGDQGAGRSVSVRATMELDVPHSEGSRIHSGHKSRL